MASKQTDIEKALLAKFDTLGLTYVSYPNAPSVEPPATSINYSVDVLYGDGVAAASGLNAPRRYVGLFQVTVRAPVTTATGDAPGMYAGLAAAETIAAAFPLGASFQYPALPAAAETWVHTRTPTITHLGKVTPEWFSTIVRIPFWCDVGA